MSTNTNPVSRLLAAMVGAILALRAGQAAGGSLTPEQEAQLEASTQELQALQEEVTADEGRIATVEGEETADAGQIELLRGDINSLLTLINGDGTGDNPGLLARLVTLETTTAADANNLDELIDGAKSDLAALADRVKTLEDGEGGLAADADAADQQLAGTTPTAVVVTPNTDIGSISAGTPTIVTTNDAGATVLTPIDPATVSGPVVSSLSGLTVSDAGVPTMPDGSAVQLGSTIAAPDGHPSVEDLAADGHPVVASTPAAGTE